MWCKAFANFFASETNQGLIHSNCQCYLPSRSRGTTINWEESNPKNNSGASSPTLKPFSWASKATIQDPLLGTCRLVTFFLTHLGEFFLLVHDGWKSALKRKYLILKAKDGQVWFHRLMNEEISAELLCNSWALDKSISCHCTEKNFNAHYHVNHL